MLTRDTQKVYFSEFLKFDEYVSCMKNQLYYFFYIVYVQQAGEIDFENLEICVYEDLYDFSVSIGY